MDFWQRAARISRKDKIINQHNIIEVIEEIRLKWFGYLKIMRSKNRISKKKIIFE